MLVKRSGPDSLVMSPPNLIIALLEQTEKARTSPRRCLESTELYYKLGFRTSSTHIFAHHETNNPYLNTAVADNVMVPVYGQIW